MPEYQSSGNVLAAIKRETTMGTAAAAGVGGFQMPLVDSPGLNLGRGDIRSARRRRDQITMHGRLGGKNPNGTYNTELLPGGAIDLLLESIARGTWEAKATHVNISPGTQLRRVIAPPVPTYHSYTVEQYDADIDESELFLGVRPTGLSLSMRPNSVVTCGWTFQGLDRQVLAVASSPYFTTPLDLTGLSLVADDSWIQYQGANIALLTGLDLTFAINAGLQPTIGSVISPDVFMNDMTISGSVMAIRSSLDAVRDFDAETEFNIKVALSVPGSDPKHTIGIYLPSVKVLGMDTPFLGGEGAKVETRNISVASHSGAGGELATAVAFYTSTETPTAVV